MDTHPSARKHGIADADIEDTTARAMTIEDQDDDIGCCGGPADEQVDVVRVPVSML